MRTLFYVAALLLGSPAPVAEVTGGPVAVAVAHSHSHRQRSHKWPHARYSFDGRRYRYE